MNRKTMLNCLQDGIEFLKAHAVPDARYSAEALLGKVLEKPVWELYAETGPVVDEKRDFQFEKLLHKRAERYPLQYLLKQVPFRNVMLEVGEGCLIPRPETEILVEKALEQIDKLKQKVVILDIGTGSGNIAVSLAKECSNAWVIATDISIEALRFAGRNAKANGVEHRVRLVQADLWSGIERIQFDMIIANPPYLAANDFTDLQPELFYEPKTALDGGYDGIDYFQRIVYGAKGFLVKNGVLLFEVGAGQADRVEGELKQNGFSNVRSFDDWAGIKRIVSGVMN